MVLLGQGGGTVVPVVPWDKDVGQWGQMVLLEQGGGTVVPVEQGDGRVRQMVSGTVRQVGLEDDKWYQWDKEVGE